MRQKYGKLLISSLLFTAAWLFIAIPVQADSTSQDSAVGNAERLASYCQTKKSFSKKVLASCKNDTNIEQMINVASHSCQRDDKSKKELSDCIFNRAKSYIDKTAVKKPKSADEYKNKLKNTLKAVPGFKDSWLDSPTDESQESLDPEEAFTGCQDNSCDDPAAVSDADCNKSACDLIKKYVNPLLNTMTLVFGLIAIISIIFGGMQYTASAGDPQKVTEAKKRITNTLIAVVAYFFLYAFLQFLVPGGIFNN